MVFGLSGVKQIQTVFLTLNLEKRRHTDKPKSTLAPKGDYAKKIADKHFQSTMQILLKTADRKRTIRRS
jgi:hypothetical protein